MPQSLTVIKGNSYDRMSLGLTTELLRDLVGIRHGHRLHKIDNQNRVAVARVHGKGKRPSLGNPAPVSLSL